MKGANSYMKILSVFFWEKNSLGQFDLFSLEARKTMNVMFVSLDIVIFYAIQAWAKT